jgi:DNA-binding NarL/FixJ family response regulator
MKRPRQITVLLADDHAPVRQGLHTLLDRDEAIRVVGEARNGREAVEMAQKFRPDVILMDISMPITNGIEATRQILAERPSAKIVVLSAHVEDEYIDRAKAVGAMGYLAKQMSAEVLTWAVHEVAMGRSLGDPVKPGGPAGKGSPGASRTAHKRLTFRESRILELMAEGFQKARIAEKLHISSSTVEGHFGALMDKLGIASIASLVAYAVASGNVENDVDLLIT